MTIPAGTSALLDVAPTNTIKSINIFGELIFKDTPLNLNVNFIRIEPGGKLLMGSSTCRLSSKIIVTFFGDYANTTSDLGLNPSDNAKLGSKGLAATTNSTLEIWGADVKTTWTRLAQAAAINATTITLEKSVSGLWKAGDAIALASTDFGPVIDSAITTTPASVQWQRGRKFDEQSEDVVIKSISTDGKTLTLQTPLKYPHFASAEFDDIRGEVGLLTRNIVFQGDASTNTTYFGGHFMIRDVTRAWINGAEFTSMAQRGVMGRYPVHFHLMGPGSMEGIAYLKDCSIHHNFQRCVTIHDTRGVTVQNNVAYWNNGHCYFLEDGCETGNKFIGNLGVAIKPVAGESGNRLVPTDSTPSIFWITNPSNDFIDNVGVGGFHTFWYSLPPSPVGISKDKYINVTTMTPRRMPGGIFSGNVAHGATQNGIHIDSFQKLDETTDSTTSWNPGVLMNFEDIVVYKNRNFGMWTRGQPFRFNNFRAYDNAIGLEAVPGTNYVENSLFVGESDNIGVARANENGRSRPSMWVDPSQWIKGLESYDNAGQQLFRNNMFKNFVSSPSRRAGALGLLSNGRFLLHPRNRVSAATFINANEFWFQKTTTSDLNNNAQILDLDGTTTGVRGGAWIVANNSITLQPDCVPRYEWNGYVCPPFRQGYFQLYMTNPDLAATNYVDPQGVDHPDQGTVGKLVPRAIFWKLKSALNPTPVSWTGIGSNYDDNSMAYYLNAQPMNAYAVRWMYNTPTPTTLKMQIQGTGPGDWILLAIPYPTSAQPFNIKYGSTKNLAQAPSLADMYSPGPFAAKNYYYYDTATQHLYIRLENTANSLAKVNFNGYGYSDYNSDYTAVTVTASCSVCATTQLALPEFGTIDSDEYYKAQLQVCQQDSSTRSTSGKLGEGVAFLAFNPTTKVLKFNVHHDLVDRATSLTVRSDSGRTLPISLSPFSPSRGFFTISYQDWKDLAQGKLSLVLATTANANGELVGRIGCEGKCTVPPVIGGQEPCANIKNATYIYSAKGISTGWTPGSWSNAPNLFNTTYSESTDFPLCDAGDTAYKVTMQRGGFQIGKWDNKFTLDTSFYTHFEVFLRTAPGMGRVVLTATLLNSTGTISSFRIGDNADYVNTFAIDELGWSRARLPLSYFGLSGVAQIRAIQFGIPYWENTAAWDKPFTFYVDNPRFVPAYTDSFTAPIAASTVASYEVTCVDSFQTSVSMPPTTTVVATPTPSTNITDKDLNEASIIPTKSNASQVFVSIFFMMCALVFIL